jgi:hypothetical protein
VTISELERQRVIELNAEHEHVEQVPDPASGRWSEGRTLHVHSCTGPCQYKYAVNRRFDKMLAELTA